MGVGGRVGGRGHRRTWLSRVRGDGASLEASGRRARDRPAHGDRYRGPSCAARASPSSWRWRRSSTSRSCCPHRAASARTASSTSTSIPGAFLRRTVDLWDPSVGAGTVPHQHLGYAFPVAPLFWCLDRVGAARLGRAAAVAGNADVPGHRRRPMAVPPARAPAGPGPSSARSSTGSRPTSWPSPPGCRCCCMPWAALPVDRRADHAGHATARLARSRRPRPRAPAGRRHQRVLAPVGGRGTAAVARARGDRAARSARCWPRPVAWSSSASECRSGGWSGCASRVATGSRSCSSPRTCARWPSARRPATCCAASATGSSTDGTPPGSRSTRPRPTTATRLVVALTYAVPGGGARRRPGPALDPSRLLLPARPRGHGRRGGGVALRRPHPLRAGVEGLHHRHLAGAGAPQQPPSRARWWCSGFAGAPRRGGGGDPSASPGRGSAPGRWPWSPSARSCPSGRAGTCPTDRIGRRTSPQYWIDAVDDLDAGDHGTRILELPGLDLRRLSVGQPGRPADAGPHRPALRGPRGPAVRHAGVGEPPRRPRPPRAARRARPGVDRADGPALRGGDGVAASRPRAVGTELLATARTRLGRAEPRRRAWRPPRLFGPPGGDGHDPALPSVALYTVESPRPIVRTAPVSGSRRARR